MKIDFLSFLHYNYEQEKNKMDRQKFNEKRFRLGANIEISLVQLLSLIVINVSLISFILNLAFKGQGALEWWSVYIICVLVFAYLFLRIFTSSGLILGRQVTLLVTVFNLFLNIANFIGIVATDALWQLAILIPAVNLFCMTFLVVVFIIRKKRFRAIILPSLSITIFSIIPIARLYLAQQESFTIPSFATAVLALAFGLFANSLILNWLGLKQSATKNYEQIKKGVDDFKRAGEKVSTVNRKINSIVQGADKMKLRVKQFFTPKSKRPLAEEELFDNITTPLEQQESGIDNIGNQKQQNGSLKVGLLNLFKKNQDNKKLADILPEEDSLLAMSAIESEDDDIS